MIEKFELYESHAVCNECVGVLTTNYFYFIPI